MKPKSSNKKTILAVDDKLDNLKVLINFLEDRGFELMVAQSGEEALKHTKRIKPDIILLDVLMPGIDGFETCRLLKSNETTKDIPVIFMTALADTVDKLKGFKVGAVDYLTKPLQHEEVLARVNAHLTIKEYQQQLQEQNILLQQKNKQLIKYTEKINADIERARIIQQQFLPALDKMPFRNKIDWDFYFKPAEHVGGDYFDVELIDRTHLAIIFSDVCGHGMSAAFITAILKTTFQSWLNSTHNLSELGVNLNYNMYRLTPIDSFATVFVAVHDIITGKSQYINFGHSPEPWLIPLDKSKPIHTLNNARSLPLGFQEQIDFQIAEVTLCPGDEMIYISDGVLENCSPDDSDEKYNSGKNEYDFDCFEKLLEENRSLEVKQIVKKIRNEIDRFTGKTEQFDDRTILAYRIKS